MFLLAQEGEVELCTNLCKSDQLALSYVTYPCLVIHTLEDSANAQDKVQYVLYNLIFTGLIEIFPNYSNSWEFSWRIFIFRKLPGQSIYNGHLKCKFLVPFFLDLSLHMTIMPSTKWLKIEGEGLLAQHTNAKGYLPRPLTVGDRRTRPAGH
jgi:hypothetical protein